MKRSWHGMGWGDLNALRSVALTLAIAAALVVYAIVSLKPFDFELPRNVRNAAAWSPDGITLDSPGVAISDGWPAWLDTAVNQRRLHLSLRLRPALSVQYGPARIISSSLNIYHRNLTIAQDGQTLIISVRTTATNDNGLYRGAPQVSIHDVFRADSWVEIALEIDGRNLTVEIDGKQRESLMLQGEPFVTWDRSFRLFIGNEATLNRPWLGTIGSMAQHHDDETAEQLQPADFDIPADYLMIRNYPKLVPLRDFSRKDAVENIVMYMPIGFLFGLWFLLRDRRLVGRAILPVFGLSLMLESTQFFISIRNPSVDDLLFNTLGGMAGIAAAAAMMMLLRWRSRIAKAKTASKEARIDQVEP